MQRLTHTLLAGLVTAALTLAPLAPITPTACAGTVAGFGGATEITQLANNIELVQQAEQQMQQYATQLQQYANEVQQLTTATQQLQNMVQNTLNIPHQIWGTVQQDLLGVANLVRQGQSLAYSASNIGSLFQSTYKGYQFPSGFSYNTTYKNWSTTTLDSLKTALEGANLQSQQFTSEQSLLQQLQTMSQSSTGQLQAIQVGSQIAEQQVEQLQKLRQLMMLQLQSQNAYMAQQANADATVKAAKADAFSYHDPRASGYQQFKGGTQ